MNKGIFPQGRIFMLMAIVWLMIAGRVNEMGAKKIKESFVIEKEEKSSKNKKSGIEGKKVVITDSVTSGLFSNKTDSLMTEKDSKGGKDGTWKGESNLTHEAPSGEDEEVRNLRNCSFSGYDKEPNSNKESFILMNPGPYVITGYEVKIEYLDMQGRMLHSRKVTLPCFVPPGENHRFDIPSWDIQHTYYYYLGNAPKRVATPFQVRFLPQAIWIEQ